MLIICDLSELLLFPSLGACGWMLSSGKAPLAVFGAGSGLRRSGIVYFSLPVASPLGCAHIQEHQLSVDVLSASLTLSLRARACKMARLLLGHVTPAGALWGLLSTAPEFLGQAHSQPPHL